MRDFNNYNPKNEGLPKDAMGILKSFASKYEGSSEDELLSEIIKQAEQGRKNGTLKDSDIESFKNMLMPMLNKTQREKLLKVIETIKNS
jgi:hypothetical protein